MSSLATKIGVLCGGNLRGIGTQLHLKKKFGEGYQVPGVIQISHSVTPQTSFQSWEIIREEWKQTQEGNMKFFKFNLLKMCI